MAGLTATPVGILSFSSRPNARPQMGFELPIKFVVLVAGGRVNGTGQVPFEMVQNRGRFRCVLGNHQQRGIAEGFGLQSLGTFDELGRRDAQQGVGVAVAGAVARLPPTTTSPTRPVAKRCWPASGRHWKKAIRRAWPAKTWRRLPR